ncbi:trehalose-phosphatase [bacterium]|nr:trehalose-phosphatase [bacterium]
MKILKPGGDPAGFFERLRAAPRRVLLLDYDGTLAPFREKRDEAVPYPGVREAVREILESGSTRLAVISGRYTRDLLPLLDIDPHPEIWGSHGWEHLWTDGRCEVPEMGQDALRGIERARAWADERGLNEQTEEKPGCFALHWRALREDKAIELEREARAAWAPFAEGTPLELHGFDGGLELRVGGRDKGDAVRAILADEQSDAAIAYLGDDLTDEDAFRELEGRGLRVLVRGEFRETRADLWLTPPEELIDFLNTWKRICA